MKKKGFDADNFHVELSALLDKYKPDSFACIARYKDSVNVISITKGTAKRNEEFQSSICSLIKEIGFSTKSFEYTVSILKNIREESEKNDRSVIMEAEKKLSASDKKKLVLIRKKKHDLVIARNYEAACLLHEKEKKLLGLESLSSNSNPSESVNLISETSDRIMEIGEMILAAVEKFNTRKGWSLTGTPKKET